MHVTWKRKYNLSLFFSAISLISYGLIVKYNSFTAAKRFTPSKQLKKTTRLIIILFIIILVVVPVVVVMGYSCIYATNSYYKKNRVSYVTIKHMQSKHMFQNSEYD